MKGLLSLVPALLIPGGLVAGGGEAPRFENPSKVRTIHAVLLSHLDIGFTAAPDSVAAAQKDSIDAAARLTRENGDFLWTIEAVWQLEEWLRRTEDPAEVEALSGLLRSGRMALGALPSTFHSAFLAGDLLPRIGLPAARIGRRLGVPAEVAIQDDVPGFIPSLPAALAGAGIRYLLLGVNTSFGGGGGIRPGANAFWWEGPDGSRVLAWVATGSYVEAEKWGFGLWARYEDIEKLMRERLEELARAGWPDEDFLVMAALGDNIPAGAAASVLERIRRWNAAHESPKIRACHPAEFFRSLEARRGSSLPVLRGDWSGWWEPVKASAPLATAEFRRAAFGLPAAEALAALAGLRGQSPYPRFDLLAAERGLLEYAEHSAGAGAGWPGLVTLDDVLRENAVHLEQASGAAARVREGIERGMERLAERLAIGRPALLVFNPLSWERGGAARAPWKGEESGELVFDCPPVPPLGHRVIAGASPPLSPRGDGGPAPMATAERLENASIRIDLDPRTGKVTAIETKDPARSWIPGGGGRGFAEAYATRSGSLFAGSRADEGRPLRRGDAAPRPVVRISTARASVRYEFPSGPLRSAEYALGPAGAEVEATVAIDGAALAAEFGDGAVLVDFDLAVDPREARFRVEAPGAWFEPERDRLNGAPAAPWTACHRAVALGSGESGVLVAPIEAPILRLLRGERSAILRTLAWTRGSEGDLRYRGKTRLDRLEPTESALRTFSWRVRFGKGAFDPVAATRFAAEVAVPLIARRIEPFFPPPGAPLSKGPEAAGEIAIEPDNVVLESLGAGESGGLSLRFREAAGRRTKARVRLPAGTGEERLEFEIGPYGVMTVTR